MQQSPRNAIEEDIMSNVPCLSTVGTFMYAMVCTQPDLAHVMSVICNFMSKSCKEYCNFLKWFLRYMKGTVRIDLLYDANAKTNPMLNDSLDLDYAKDLDKRRSLTECVFKLWNSIISWKTTLQLVVALS